MYIQAEQKLEKSFTPAVLEQLLGKPTTSKAPHNLPSPTVACLHAIQAEIHNQYTFSSEV